MYCSESGSWEEAKNTVADLIKKGKNCRGAVDLGEICPGVGVQDPTVCITLYKEETVTTWS